MDRICLKTTLIARSAPALYGLRIRRRVSVDLVYHGETSGIVPHGPTDAVFLQRRTHVGDPLRAVCGRGKAAIGAELVAGYRNMMFDAPRSGYADFAIDALGAPSIFAVA